MGLKKILCRSVIPKKYYFCGIKSCIMESTVDFVENSPDLAN